MLTPPGGVNVVGDQCMIFFQRPTETAGMGKYLSTAAGEREGLWPMAI